jgi:hypothetical protein
MLLVHKIAIFLTRLRLCFMMKANYNVGADCNVSKRKLPNPFAEKVMTADKLAAKTAPEAPAIYKKVGKKRLLVLITVVVLAAAGVGVYLFLQNKNENDATKTTTQKPDYKQTSFSELVSDDYEGDQKALDVQIAAAATDAEKAALYTQKSSLVVMNKGYEDPQALEFATQADTLAPSPISALQIATMKQAARDTAGALEYYKLYLSRVTGEYKLAHPGEFEHYQAMVQELEQQ